MIAKKKKRKEKCIKSSRFMAGVVAFGLVVHCSMKKLLLSLLYE
jgi:hypothetical protein